MSPSEPETVEGAVVKNVGDRIFYWECVLHEEPRVSPDSVVMAEPNSIEKAFARALLAARAHNNLFHARPVSASGGAE
jgi:hypothetical protein